MKLEDLKEELEYDPEIISNRDMLKPKTEVSNLIIKRYLGYRILIRHSRGKVQLFKDHMYLCECKCGTKNLIYSEYNLKSAMAGRTTLSCGCVLRDNYERMKVEPIAIKYNDFRTQSHIGYILAHIKERCKCKTYEGYKRYGEQGITICKEWDNNVDGLDNFGHWMIYAGYREELFPGISVNRVNNNKGYSPDNCYLSYQAEQNNNTSANKIIDWYGEQYTACELAKKFGIDPHKLRDAINPNKQNLDLYEAIYRKSINMNLTSSQREKWLSQYPNNQYIPHTIIKEPFEYTDHSEISINDPRRYYIHPNHEQAMDVIALQARLTARDEGHPVKPFEYTNSGSDSFIGREYNFNRFFERKEKR